MRNGGILPVQAIERLLKEGVILCERPLAPDQLQPASLDLRLGTKAYRVRASFLPGPRRSLSERLEQLSLHVIDLQSGAVLETGCVYIVPLLESLKLPKGLSAAANPKSSTGRLDIFTRVITDNAAEFDTVAEGYEGPLYAEISPRTFPSLVRTGSRLSQIRFRAGAMRRSESNLALSVDLEGQEGEPVGFRAKRHSGLVDVDPGDHGARLRIDLDQSLLFELQEHWIESALVDGKQVPTDLLDAAGNSVAVERAHRFERFQHHQSQRSLPDIGLVSHPGLLWEHHTMSYGEAIRSAGCAVPVGGSVGVS